MINTWDSYCVTPEEEGSGTKVLDANDQVQPSLEAGDNIIIEDGHISADGTLANVQANWQTIDPDDPSYIRNKPQNLVQDADYVHIDNNFTDADVSKLEGIEAGAQVNVKPDWDAVAGSAAEILNKPTIPTVDQIYNANSTNAQSGVAVASAVSGAISEVNQVPASISTDAGKVLKVNDQGEAVWGTDEGTTYTAGNGLSLNGTEFSVDTSVVATQSDLSDYQPVISDLSTIRSGAAAGASAVQPGSLATVATTGSYNDLTDKPVIPPGVVVDQTYDATSANAQSGVAMAGALATKQDTINDLSTIRSGAAAGATAVQPGSLATVATSGSYNDLTDKPTIPPGVVVDQTYDATSANAQSGVAMAGALATKQDTISDLSTIRSGAAAGATAVQPGDLPATKPLVAGSNVTITENANNVTISATDTDTTYSAGTGLSLSGTTFNVDKPVPTTQSSDNGKVLGVTDASGTLGWVSQPSPATVDQTYDATSANAQSGVAMAGALATKQDTISDLNTIRSGASAGATAVQPASLATVATSGSYADLNNKPTIPTVDQTYNASSTNAQSGTAVAQAIASIPSSSYTAGDGIAISAQNEVSAVGGTGITVTQASQSTGTLTSTVNSWSQIETLAPLTSDLMGLIDNGLTITLTADVAPYILSYQPTQVYLVIFSNYANYAVLSQLQGATFSEVDSAWFVSNMPSQITFDSGDYNSSLSTISLDTIRANPSNHYLSFLFVTSNGNRLASAVGFNGAWSQGTSITTGSYSVTVPGKITVTNPVPSYNTSADNGKVLSVGSNGLEWDTPQSGSTYTAGEGIDITSDVISVDHDSTLTTNSVSGSLSATVGQWSDLPYVGDLTSTLAGYMDSDGLPVTLTNGKSPSIHRYPVALYLALYKDASHYVVLSQIPGVTFLYDGEYAYTAQGVPNQVTYSGADYNSAKSTDTWSDVLASPTSYKISYIFDCSTYGYLIANNVGFDSSWTSGQTVTTGTYNISSNKITVTNPVPAYSTSTDSGKALAVGSNGLEWVNSLPIQVVASMPASPTSGVLYIVTGA